MLSRLKSLFHILFWLSVGLVMLWFLGFVIFIVNISTPPHLEYPYQKTDAIVVLTGGEGRVRAGFSLLKQDVAPKLFISGVQKGVTEQDIFSKSFKAPSAVKELNALSDSLDLGHTAENTRGNAQEVATWLHNQTALNHLVPLKSIRLVTSTYHMPRSLLELHQILPNLIIIPHPIFSETFRQKEWWRKRDALSLAFSEYTKYSLVLLRILYQNLKDFF